MGTQGERRNIPWDEAVNCAREVVYRIKTELLTITEIRVAGSVRRLCNYVNDLDFVVVTPNGALPYRLEYMFAFNSFGTKRATAILSNGMQADFIACEADEFATTLLFFTGSREFNIRMRMKAKRAGFSLSERGLTRAGLTIRYMTEEEVFSAIGMTFIEPEARI